MLGQAAPVMRPEDLIAHAERVGASIFQVAPLFTAVVVLLLVGYGLCWVHGWWAHRGEIAALRDMIDYLKQQKGG